MELTEASSAPGSGGDDFPGIYIVTSADNPTGISPELMEIVKVQKSYANNFAIQQCQEVEHRQMDRLQT